MFGLFGFKPPLTTRQRAELELLMRRIIQRIGEATVREAEMVCELGQLSLDLADEESLLLSAAAEVRRRMQLTDANVQLKIVRADSTCSVIPRPFWSQMRRCKIPCAAWSRWHMSIHTIFYLATEKPRVRTRMND